MEIYEEGQTLLQNYREDIDILFLDIQLPDITGMEVAKQIRKIDKNVLIVFVTNLHQYAIEGYEVGAFDFVLKPLNYTGFSMKLERICNELLHKSRQETYTIKTRQGMRKLLIIDIDYVEVMNHDLIFHMGEEKIKIRRTMSELVRALSPYYFSQCNSCYLVNLRRIEEIKGNVVRVGNELLTISKQKRKPFLEDVAKYIGGSV